MLRITLLLFSLLFFSYPVVAIPTNGLIGGWVFSGDETDISGNGNTGIVDGATRTSDRFGVSGSAYSFDGNDKIILPLDLTTELNAGDPITLSLWFQTTSASSQILLAGNPGGGPDFLSLVRSDGLIQTRLYGGSAGFSDSPLNDGQWHHMAWGTDGSTSFYFIDGEVQVTAPVASTFNREIELWLGTRLSGDLRYIGQLDDVLVYDRALSTLEISELADNFIPEPSSLILSLLSLSCLCRFGKSKERKVM